MVTYEDLESADYVLSNFEQLAEQNKRVQQWLTIDPSGSQLLSKHNANQRARANRRASELHISPGKFLILCYQRWFSVLSVALFHGAMCSDSFELCQALVGDTDGALALDVIRNVCFNDVRSKRQKRA